MNLAGVVLAAGKGTRLRPLTYVRPKPLCPVDNIPLLDRALEHVLAVTPTVAVNVHYGRALMETHLAGRDLHLSIEEPQPLGTAGALGQLRDWIDGRPVLVANGDAYREGDLRDFVDGWDGERVRLLVTDDRERGDFGPWRYAGAALMPWDEVRALAPEPTGLYEVSWERLEGEARLDLVPTAGRFIDCGTATEYIDANLAASGGESVVGDGSVVTGELDAAVVWPGGEVGADERLVRAVRVWDWLTVPG